MDILLDNNGDILVSEQGDIYITDSVKQKIRTVLLWFEGEWRWDDEMGLPWGREILVKNPDIMLFESQAKEAILEIEEVANVDYLTILVDTSTRRATVKYRVKTAYEEIIESEVIIDGIRSN